MCRRLKDIVDTTAVETIRVLSLITLLPSFDLVIDPRALANRTGIVLCDVRCTLTLGHHS
jgi:hypothetical protein